MTPGWTRIHPLSRSISRIRFIRESPSSKHPGTGSAPPDSPVPAPRGTMGMPAATAIRTTATTSSVEAGSTTTLGATRKLVRPSHS